MPDPALQRIPGSRRAPQLPAPEVLARTVDSSEIPTADRLAQVVVELKKWQKDHADRNAQGYYDRLQRACSWLAKAKRASDPEGRFVFSWIALNALYGIRPDVLKTGWWKSEEAAAPARNERQYEDQVPRELEWFLWRMCELALLSHGSEGERGSGRHLKPEAVEPPYMKEAWETSAPARRPSRRGAVRP